MQSLSAGRVGACFRFQPMSPHPSVPLFKEKTLSGLNLVSCHQLGEGGIALASYNRCLFYTWIYEFLLCNSAYED